MKWCAPARILIAGLSIAALSPCGVEGQQQLPEGASAVQKASFDRSTLRDAGQTVRFNRRPARVGDEVEQAISLEMRLATSLRQGNELTGRGHTSIRAQQRRIVETTDIEAGRTVAVRVRYIEATKQVTASDGAEPAQDSDEAALAGQPIAGKTYRCRREPDADGKLVITDENGHIPPLDEYEIVAQHMEMVGRANPLAEFLAGKTVAIGETVELPRKIADTIFNFGEQFGEVVRFDLALERTQMEADARCAVFIAHVEAASSDASQMRMELQGPLVVQVDTCRAAHVDLSGPIGMSETRGTYSTAYQMIGTGKLKMRTVSAYRDAKR